MNTPVDSQQTATLDNPYKRQDDDKTGRTSKARLRARAAEGTVAYWKAKLFRNTYRDRQGRTVEIPEYYVRMRHAGETRRVRLKTSDREKAAEQALFLSKRLQAEGWRSIEEGQARLPASLSIEDFCAAYQEATKRMERPPRPVSVNLYLRQLRQLCALANVKQLRELTPEAVERARDAYRANARAEGRNPNNSLGTITRNARACFSREALAIFARQGLQLQNPFANVPRTQRIDPVTPLNRDVVSRIWNELPLLRDGDPSAAAVSACEFRREYEARHSGHKARWLPIDYTRPQKAAYCTILLAIGLGLRANEIDKARWSWLQFDADGNCFLEVREEDDFVPKGGTKRFISVPNELHDFLSRARPDANSAYIIGGGPSEAVRKTGMGYRNREPFRVANAWLRARGVEADDPHGNPLHRLRKQFGSEIATQFGLFAAQKMLGHASPTVTSKYYAAQTNLPKLTHLRLVG